MYAACCDMPPGSRRESWQSFKAAFTTPYRCPTIIFFFFKYFPHKVDDKSSELSNWHSQLFQASATVRHCLTSFKVKIQLDHFCIGNGS